MLRSRNNGIISNKHFAFDNSYRQRVVKFNFWIFVRRHLAVTSGEFEGEWLTFPLRGGLGVKIHFCGVIVLKIDGWGGVK